MKHFILSLLTVIISISPFAQVRVCPSVINLNQIQTQDPDRYQRFMNLETFTANYIVNHGSIGARLINPDGIITIPVAVHVLHRGRL